MVCWQNTGRVVGKIMSMVQQHIFLRICVFFLPVLGVVVSVSLAVFFEWRVLPSAIIGYACGGVVGLFFILYKLLLKR